MKPKLGGYSPEAEACGSFSAVPALIRKKPMHRVRLALWRFPRAQRLQDPGRGRPDCEHALPARPRVSDARPVLHSFPCQTRAIVLGIGSKAAGSCQARIQGSRSSPDLQRISGPEGHIRGSRRVHVAHADRRGASLPPGVGITLARDVTRTSGSVTWITRYGIAEAPLIGTLRIGSIR